MRYLFTWAILVLVLVVSRNQCQAGETKDNAAGVPGEPRQLPDAAPAAPTPAEVAANDDDVEIVPDVRSGRFYAQFTTKTKNMFMTTTKTKLSTCFSATDSACTGRRRRSLILKNSEPFALEKGPDDVLSGSQGDAGSTVEEWTAEGEDEQRKKNRDGKNLTYWSTVFSTYKVTSTLFVDGTTVFVSGQCSVAGLDSSCFG